MKLLREANAIERARNDLLEARQVVHEQAVQEERYWERTYVSDFPAITPEEGRKMFSEEMKKAYAKYVGQDHGNKIKVAMAHAAGSELFEHRSKTVQGQRAARAVKTKVDDKKKPPVVPKTPITPGGGRVLPPPTAGSASTRVEQPKPKTTTRSRTPCSTACRCSTSSSTRTGTRRRSTAWVDPRPASSCRASTSPRRDASRFSAPASTCPSSRPPPRRPVTARSSGCTTPCPGVELGHPAPVQLLHPAALQVDGNR
jgi:hypothetical protein